MSLLPIKSISIGLIAIIAVAAYSPLALAQETMPGEQKTELSENALQKDRMQKSRDGKQEGKQGEMQGDRKKRPGSDGRQMPPKADEAEGALQRIRQLLKKLDTDGDGAISKSEAPERLLARFDRIDANGDEKIDQQEIVSMRKKMGDRGGSKPGDRPPMTDKPPGKDGTKSKKSDNKGPKKMRDRDPGQNDPTSGSVEPVRPGDDG